MQGKRTVDKHATNMDSPMVISQEGEARKNWEKA